MATTTTGKKEETTTMTTNLPTTIWEADFTSGTSPAAIKAWTRRLLEEGAVGTGDSPTDDNYRNVAGIDRMFGIQAHDDFTWAARRFAEDGSHAVYQQAGRGAFAIDALGRTDWERCQA